MKSRKTMNNLCLADIISYICKRILDADILLKPWKSPLRIKSKCTRMSQPE